MKKSGAYLVLALIVMISLNSYAKKDINAWKNEESLDQQYEVFKENLNFWNGSYFLKGLQLDEFYSAMNDTINGLEKSLADRATSINNLQEELDAKNVETQEFKSKLEESLRNQNAIDVFGIKVHKNVYTLLMSSLILGLLVLLVVVFLMYKRSNQVTLRSKKEYDELKDEFEVHKKNSLERYTKINTELHKTRLELNKR